MSAIKFRVRLFGTLDGKNYGPMLDLEYAGTPIGWTTRGEPIQVGSIIIEPVGTTTPGTPGTFTSVCGVPAMGGSPICELERGHEGFHTHTETDETGKEHVFHWGKGKPFKDDIEARLFRALEVLLYVAEVYQSPIAKDAIAQLTAEEFVP
jgi:hypothetical protein